MTDLKRGDPISVTITGTLTDLFTEYGPKGALGPVIQLAYGERRAIGEDLFVRLDGPSVQVRRLVPEEPQ